MKKIQTQLYGGDENNIQTSDKLAAVNRYCELLGMKYKNRLYSMQPISLTMKGFLNHLPNTYSVTDKADGNKVGILIFKKEMYLLNSNMQVSKYSKINLDKKVVERLRKI